jgi:hypothetical protein
VQAGHGRALGDVPVSHNRGSARCGNMVQGQGGARQLESRRGEGAPRAGAVRHSGVVQGGGMTAGGGEVARRGGRRGGAPERGGAPGARSEAREAPPSAWQRRDQGKPGDEDKETGRGGVVGRM